MKQVQLTDVVFYAPTLGGRKLDKMHLEVIGQENGDARLRSVFNPKLVFVTKETQFENVTPKDVFFTNQLLEAKKHHIETVNEYTRVLRNYADEMAENYNLKEELLELNSKYLKVLDENILLLKKLNAYETPNYN